jgi:hypothetical protein
MGYVLKLVSQLLLEIAIGLLFYSFFKFVIFDLFWVRSGLGEKAKTSRKAAFSMSMLFLLFGYFSHFLIVKPPSFNETGFESDVFDGFSGFLYDPGSKSTRRIEKEIVALFDALYKHPSQIKYLDVRYMDYSKRLNKGYAIVTNNGPSLDNSDFEFYRISYTDIKSRCEDSDEHLRKSIPKYWRYFEGGLSNPLLGNNEKCLYVRKISADEASRFEYKASAVTPFQRSYYPPFFHIRTSIIPVVSPTNRKNIRVHDIASSEQVYISSATNGIMPGTFIDIWGFALPGPADSDLIKKFLSKYAVQ